jgi:phosphopentomutase
MRRAIVIVLDGVGAGAAPDAPLFGDTHQPSTLINTWNAVGGFMAPNLRAAGFLAAGGIGGEVTPPHGWRTEYGRLKPLSLGGKDSVTGHWEMMGIVMDAPFPTYPQGFPESLVREFEQAIGRKTIGNKAASGTAVIAELGPLHMETGSPILYTSADSVFQLACHEEIVPIETLYEWCLIARRLCEKPHNVQRIIARPFLGSAGEGFVRTERRKDFPLEAPANLVDELGDVLGIGVVPELFLGRGFRQTKRTQSNAEHAHALLEALASDARFIFANFEDFDMLYGHRNDAPGFARALEEFDAFLGVLMMRLGEGDLLILTSDHGNDPTDVSTDHTREYVPFVKLTRGTGRAELGDLDGFAHVGEAVRDHLQGGTG